MQAPGRRFRANFGYQLACWCRRPYSAAMSNRVPVHLFEIVFYTTAALLTAIGVVWVWLH
jgi:hypothetical protein